ncbi:receptor-like serine/threonine-protein kinase SD1-8 [Cinnamomum micranthum f. kanehirae]|uniref:Receptor-like serine/threonine-protein kinase n=1 Tax=Cinnamomum micranthum f. kanehirae TaxID=337451 RepID=A0A443PRY7_9MAGN|nr:receptor-like serine/threonine-protein kinase SD1-8 [Cinnamomum micranthum f. kanehirae]
MASLRTNRSMRIFISLVFLSLWNPCSDAAESITNTQSLATFETLVSPNRNFVLGFFTPTSASGFYVGIWVSNDTTRQVVWVANRENPIRYFSPSLKINHSGNLVISSDYYEEIPITSVTWASTTTNTSAKLLDNGNLVLVEGANGRVLWQSFDHPTDTLLPGMKLRNLTSWLNDEVPYPGPFTLGIDPNGTNRFVIYYRGVVYWTSRLWNVSEYVKGSHMYHPHSIHYRFESDKDGKYFIFTINQTANDDQPILNWVMTSSGQVGRGGWFMLSTTGLWWREVEPKSPCDGTNEEDGSVGCRGRAWPKCGDRNGSAFSKDKTTIGYNKEEYNSTIALRDCEFTCRSSCACIAYNTASDDGTGCLFWHDDVKEQAYMEPYNVSAFIREDRKNLLTTVDKNPGRKRWSLWAIIMLPVSFIIFLSVCILCGVLQRKIVRKEEKNAKRELSVLELHANRKDGENFSDIGKMGLELPIFSFYNVLAATDNFLVANKLGEGGFGPVYKGKLLNEQEVAMKRLSRNSGQGPEEFKNEILSISKLQHKNLVKLIGICLHREEKILIYEYMPNKSLDFFLFDPSKREILDWEKRVHIIDGIAQGLLYLHKYSRLTVIHRDLKASNILLDGDMNPKISDFGMARIFSGNEAKANTNRVVGTYGYMSPEYAMEGLFSVKSDVFSFGVLLLEIMTSKKNTRFQHSDHSLNLLGYAWELYNEGRGLELIDPILVDSSLATELVRYIHVALLCVQERATDRPTMSEVILFLTNQNADMLSPRQPAFFIGRNAPATSSPSSRPRPCSVNDVTISTMDGR